MENNWLLPLGVALLLIVGIPYFEYVATCVSRAYFKEKRKYQVQLMQDLHDPTRGD